MELKKKCKICKDMVILMKPKGISPYYYHYSVNYSKCCSQRMKINDERLIEWTKDDDIRTLTRLLRQERRLTKNKCLDRRKVWG